MLTVEDSIWHIDDFSFSTHDFRRIEGDLFYDPFESLDAYGIADLEGLAEYDREASEEIRDDIFARKGKYRSSYSRSCEKTTSIYMEALEYEKSSSDPYEKEYRESYRREEFAYDHILEADRVFDLTEDEADEIGYDGYDEEAFQSLVYIVYECPCLRRESHEV